MRKIYEYDTQGERHFILQVPHKLEHYSFKNNEFEFTVKKNDKYYNGPAYYLVDLKDKMVTRCTYISPYHPGYIYYENFMHEKKPIVTKRTRIAGYERKYGSKPEVLTANFAYTHFFETHFSVVTHRVLISLLFVVK